jgi:ABC-type Fe3+/spermidine/putrescine transport system ATPase subunit
MLKFGEKVMNTVPPHKRNTGMVFQNYALWPHLTVRGNVEYGLKVRKVPRAERDRQVNQALEMVRLGGLSDRYPGQLSGGQQQRVALARALIIRPDILLLDEPLSNLDAQLRLEMRREIKRLHAETGVTALYVTHDQEEALSIADRIAVMREGVLQQVGTPRDLYRRPRSRFVAEFIGETNLLPGVLKQQNNREMSVETPVGIVRAQQPAAEEATFSLAIGQNVWCSIRPESWHVLNEAQNNGDNRFAARLENVMYLGESEQYQVQLTGGVEQAGTDAPAEPWRAVKLSVANPGAAAPQTGDALTVGCAPQDVVVLAE